MSLERTATIVSSITAFILLIMKLVVWFMSSSISVLSSAIDSLLDLFVSIFNFFAVKNAEKPADEQFNYGRWKIEWLASFLEWIIITLSWFYILYESINKLINWEKIEFIWIWITVMLVSVIITWWLVYFLQYVANKTNNLVIKSDALHYKTDLYTNAWILLALVWIHFTWFYQIDAIVWIIISVYIVYSAWELIEEWYLNILDVSLDKEDVEKIKKFIDDEELVNDYHFLKTRASWQFKFVDVHLVFNPTIKLIDAHNASDNIEDKIMELDKDKQWVINIHLDPYDDSAQNEDKCNVFFDKA